MQLESLQVGVLSTRTLRQAQACSHGNSPESGYIFKNIIGLQLKLLIAVEKIHGQFSSNLFDLSLVVQDYSLSELNNVVRAYLLELNVQKLHMKLEASRFGNHAVHQIQIPEAEFTLNMDLLKCGTSLKPSACFHPIVQTCAVNVNNMDATLR
ncbi:hypothetical protein DAPPUDRAFT_119644 [Daphnia pulex]|uniref:Uncharacterized protein n=1 Tax=Daphnia pulex TaxID=6669 RepID=E9HZ49_DAPPU|nr:hypothetical protein DAPPUDRAFT_119644 [Daphnia pulex]|eukprot:EFX62982.1 hypothetical protein DAPPUDRAFT_119644 [Daphnia pulex]